MKARPFLADRVRQGHISHSNINESHPPNIHNDRSPGALPVTNQSGTFYSSTNGVTHAPPYYAGGGSSRTIGGLDDATAAATRHAMMADAAAKSSTYPHRGVFSRRSYNSMSKSPVFGSNLRKEPHVDSFYQSQLKTKPGHSYAANDLLDQISGTSRTCVTTKGLLTPMHANGGGSHSDGSVSGSPRLNGMMQRNNGYNNRKFLSQSRSDGTIANSGFPPSTRRQGQDNGYGMTNGSAALFRNASSCDEMDGRCSSKQSFSSIPPSPSSASSTGSFLSNRLPYASRTPYDSIHSDRLFPGTSHMTSSMYDNGPSVTVQERYYNGSSPGTPDGNAFERRGVHRRPIHASTHSDNGGFRASDMVAGPGNPAPNNDMRGFPPPGSTAYSDTQNLNPYRGDHSNIFDAVDGTSPGVVLPSTKQSSPQSQEEPADVAAKLFTLNGYKDSEVAPLLGKNSDFSQSVCSEYLKFFDFRGLGLDEALRLFLKKFPLTGETQERERILVHFSKRFFECNSPAYGSEDATHTLTCALMLLNSDLHGQNIGNKMTLQEFINNLSGLCDGKDFPKEVLKPLYHSIKTRQMEWLTAREAKDYGKLSPRMRRKNSAPGNPFVELKVDDNAVVMKEGLVYRKCVMDADGKRTPAIRRGWKLFYGILRGLVLFLYKADHVSCDYPLTVGVHHALAGYANDYKKRPFVFKLITSDWRVFLFQSKSKADVQEWIDGINMSAAVLSSPPLPAPCSSSKHFQRPVMPVATTRLPISEQLQKHENLRKEVEEEVTIHRSYQPKPSAKDYKEWESKMDYLEFALKRFSSYVHVLTAQRLKHGVEILVANRVRSKSAAAADPKMTMTAPLSAGGMAITAALDGTRRSSSVGDFSTMRTSPQSQRKNSKQRQSYLMAVYP